MSPASTLRSRVLGSFGLVVAAVALAVAPAGAATTDVPHGLRWASPHVVQAGVAGDFRSIDPCPASRPDGSPLQGTPMVQLTVLFPHGSGGVGNVFPLAADGSWTATWDPNIDPSFVGHGRTTIQADCLDVTFTGVLIARYQVHTLRLT